MTRVELLVVHTVDIPLVRPFVTAVRRADSMTAVLVEAIDSDGRRGWGEAAASWKVTGESATSIRAAVEGPLSSVVLGREIEDIAQIGDLLAGAVIHNAAARSAVDCALYDLAARQCGLALWAYLGGTDACGIANKVTSDMTLSAASTNELVDLAIAHRNSGFRTLKLKVGAGQQDFSAVAAVREAVGAETALRVDANQGWTARHAIDVIRGWEDAGLNIELVEQPVPAQSLDDLAFVTAHVSTPILADESVWTARDLAELVNRHAASLINIKLAKSGGLTEARRMVDFARKNEVGVLIGCMMESHVGIAAAASLAAALGGPARTHDLDAGLWLTAAPVISGPRYVRDAIVLSEKPGTGILCLASAQHGGER